MCEGLNAQWLLTSVKSGNSEMIMDGASTYLASSDTVSQYTCETEV